MAFVLLLRPEHLKECVAIRGAVCGEANSAFHLIAKLGQGGAGFMDVGLGQA